MPKAVENENDVSAVSRMGPAQLFDVSSKLVLVTGGGSGIGAMIAMGFVAGGSTVVICSRKDNSALAEELTAKGPGKCVAMTADLASDEGVAAFAEAFCAQYDHLDVLVNNSGTNWSESVETYSMKGWDKVYALNVKAVFHLTQKLLPLLEKGAEKSNAHSSVINISSIDSLQVTLLPTFAYSSGKAAVSHMSRVLAGHLAERKITVNSVLPGPFMSRMMRGTIEAASEKAIADQTALGRLGKEEDMAGVCIYLASPAGGYVTGASITVDGGSLVRIKSAM